MFLSNSDTGYRLCVHIKRYRGRETIGDTIRFRGVSVNPIDPSDMTYEDAQAVLEISWRYLGGYAETMPTEMMIGYVSAATAARPMNEDWEDDAVWVGAMNGVSDPKKADHIWDAPPDLMRSQRPLIFTASVTNAQQGAVRRIPMAGK